MKIRPLFAWYDWWFGGYWNRKSRTLYLMVPFVGITFHRCLFDMEETPQTARCLRCGGEFGGSQ